MGNYQHKQTGKQIHSDPLFNSTNYIGLHH